MTLMGAALQGLRTAALLTAPAVMALALPAHADAGAVLVTRAEDVGMSSERLEAIGVGMRRLIDEKKIPGTVTLVARRGKVVHFEANGLRDVDAGLPMRKDTIFRLYSQSKPVTGVAVMILFEEGHFLLSDPISKFLPEFAEMRVYVGERTARSKPSRAPHHHPPPAHAHIRPELRLFLKPRRSDIQGCRRERLGPGGKTTQLGRVVRVSR